MSSKYSTQPLTDLAIAQLDGDRDLAVAERFEVERFLPGFAGGWSFVTLLRRHK